MSISGARFCSDRPVPWSSSVSILWGGLPMGRGTAEREPQPEAMNGRQATGNRGMEIKGNGWHLAIAVGAWIGAGILGLALSPASGRELRSLPQSIPRTRLTFSPFTVGTVIAGAGDRIYIRGHSGAMSSPSTFTAWGRGRALCSSMPTESSQATVRRTGRWRAGTDLHDPQNGRLCAAVLFRADLSLLRPDRPHRFVPWIPGRRDRRATAQYNRDWL